MSARIPAQIIAQQLLRRNTVRFPSIGGQKRLRRRLYATFVRKSFAFRIHFKHIFDRHGPCFVEFYAKNIGKIELFDIAQEVRAVSASDRVDHKKALFRAHNAVFGVAAAILGHVDTFSPVNRVVTGISCDNVVPSLSKATIIPCTQVRNVISFAQVDDVVLRSAQDKIVPFSRLNKVGASLTC